MTVPSPRRMVIALALLIGSGHAGATSSDRAVRPPLKDPLDRPGDGYCVDKPGISDNMRLDLPLFAHDCKPVLAVDSAGVLQGKGEIRFPAVAAIGQKR